MMLFRVTTSKVLNRPFAIHITRDNKKQPYRETHVTADHNPLSSGKYRGLSCHPFHPSISKVLQAPVKLQDLVVDKEKGWLYLKEEKYHELLNQCFGSSGNTYLSLFFFPFFSLLFLYVKLKIDEIFLYRPSHYLRLAIDSNLTNFPNP